MSEGSIASVRHKIDIAWKSAAGGLAALIAALVAVGFFSAAAFLWIDARDGAIAASLVLGGAFVALALTALLAVVLLHRRKPPPAALPPWWSDPALLAVALDASRALGRRRTSVAVLAAAFVIGVLLNRPRTNRADDAQH